MILVWACCQSLIEYAFPASELGEEFYYVARLLKGLAVVFIDALTILNV